MDAWWAKEGSEGPAAGSRQRAVAYYRHSAQDRQENSIPLQREQVQKWAQEHGIRIIQEFADHGKSGLSAQDRDAFNEMFEHWVRKRNDFEYILVLDVSRWGRFQDIDLSATYSAECTRHGKKVVYTSLGLPKKDDPLHAMVVGFERYRAAQYSRELSDKVFRGASKIIQQGFRVGGAPPYGLQRILLDEDRQPVQVLKSKQRKSIQNQRVTLAPGDPREVAVVLRIFEECVAQRRNPEEIMRGLNQDGIVSPGGTGWHASTVWNILTNEAYIGTLVYNKSCQKLKAGMVSNPRAQWIRTPSAFQGIVPRELFEQAQQVLTERERRSSAEYQLEQLKLIFERRGALKYGMVASNGDILSVRACTNRFGSLGGAFQHFYPEVAQAVKETVRTQLRAQARELVDYEDFLVLDRRLTVLVQPSVPVPYGFRTYWPFHPDPRNVIDLTLGVFLSDARERRILGYLGIPRLLVRAHPIRLFPSDQWRIALFGHKGLDFIRTLLDDGGAHGPQQSASHEGSAL